MLQMHKLITSSQVIKIKLSFQLIKTQFRSKFLIQVFELNQDVQLKYSS